MSGIDALIREVRSLDAPAGQTTRSYRLGPRATILAILAFILVVVSFDRYAIAALLPLAIFPVALARLGDIPLHRIGFKVMLAMPFALMIGLFNPLFDPAPRMELLGQAIAGVLVLLPSILVMDEPGSGLDPAARRRVIKLLSGFDHTKVIATHDLDLVLDLCSRVLVMKEGVIEADGAPAEIFADADLLLRCNLELPLNYQRR